MSDKLIYKTEDASKGGFAAVLKVEGLLASMKRIPSRFTDSNYAAIPSDQVEVVLDDVVILEMAEGEDEPELQDGRFTFWINYAKPGKPKPHQSSTYIKGFVATAEKLGVTLPPDGTQRVVLEMREVPLGFTAKGAEDEAVGHCYCFVGEEAEGVEGLEDRAVGLIVDKNPNAALRACLLDTRVKHCTDVIEALRGGTIAGVLPVELDEATGLYVAMRGNPDAIAE